MKDRGHKIERMKRYKIENELCLADIFLVQETHRIKINVVLLKKMTLSSKKTGKMNFEKKIRHRNICCFQPTNKICIDKKK